MNKYKVKNFQNEYPADLQMEYKSWIESREKINVANISFWHDSRTHINFCTVTYTETDFNL